MYEENLKDLEEDLFFNDLFLPPLTLTALTYPTPIFLVAGKYSVGKTTFIEHLLEQEFSWTDIRPEKSTQQYTAISHTVWNTVEGCAGTVTGNSASTWNMLNDQESEFSEKFCARRESNDKLKNLTIIDTPGFTTDYTDTHYGGGLHALIAQADLILLMFDDKAGDMDIAFKDALTYFSLYDRKVMLSFNKADSFDPDTLLRDYGSLMSNMGHNGYFRSNEIKMVYFTSWGRNCTEAGKPNPFCNLITKNEQKVRAKITELPKEVINERINNFEHRVTLLMQMLEIIKAFWSHCEKEKCGGSISCSVVSNEGGLEYARKVKKESSEAIFAAVPHTGRNKVDPLVFQIFQRRLELTMDMFQKLKAAAKNYKHLVGHLRSTKKAIEAIRSERGLLQYKDCEQDWFCTSGIVTKSKEEL